MEPNQNNNISNQNGYQGQAPIEQGFTQAPMQQNPMQQAPMMPMQQMLPPQNPIQQAPMMPMQQMLPPQNPMQQAPMMPMQQMLPPQNPMQQAPMMPMQQMPGLAELPTEKKPLWKKLVLTTLILSIIGTGGYFLKDHYSGTNLTASSKIQTETKVSPVEIAKPEESENIEDSNKELVDESFEPKSFGLEFSTTPKASDDTNKSILKYSDNSLETSLKLEISEIEEGMKLEAIEICSDEKAKNCVPIRRISNKEIKEEIEISGKELAKAIKKIEIAENSKIFFQIAYKDIDSAMAYSRLMQFSTKEVIKKKVAVKKKEKLETVEEKNKETPKKKI